MSVESAMLRLGSAYSNYISPPDYFPDICFSLGQVFSFCSFFLSSFSLFFPTIYCYIIRFSENMQ